MLAGCSSTLLSPRHRLRSEAASVPLQACHLQVQEKLYPAQQKMSTQRLDLPCGFSRKEGPRIAISLEKAVEARGSCSFRPNTVTTSSASAALVAQAAAPPWEARREIEGGGYWEKGATLKRFHDWAGSTAEDPCEERVKRRRKIYRDAQLAGGAGAEVWFPIVGSTAEQYSPLREEEERAAAGAFYLPGVGDDALVSSFGSEIVEKGDNDVGGTSEGSKQRTKTESNPASEQAHSSASDLRANSPGFEAGNGSHRPNPSWGAAAAAGAAAAGEGGGSAAQRLLLHQGLELVNLLTACVESIGSRNHEATTFFLARLGELASPGGSPIHRVAAYFTEALVLLVVRLWPHVFCVSLRRELPDHGMEDDGGGALALRLLNHVSPVPKFLHFTLNERLLRAFQGKDRVHIIDFDIKEGLQWPSLFQSLATRPDPPRHVRITGIGESKQELQETGARLAAVAEALRLPFEFHVVVDRLEDVRLWMLHVKEGECVAVNCVLQLHKLLYDDGGAALGEFLRLVRSTNPDIVLVAEQEAGHNDRRWEARFAGSLRYYAAVFDMMESTGLPADSPARAKVEEMFAREIRNIVAGEGAERVERHEVFTRWRRLMEGRGFRSAGIGEREMMQSRMLLRLFPCKNYAVEKQGEDDAGLTLRWLDQPLYTVSAWAPMDAPASSSSKPVVQC